MNDEDNAQNVTALSTNVRPIPTSPAALLALRLNEKAKTLNDQIDNLLNRFIGDDTLRAYLEPMIDATAVTGKVEFDLYEAGKRLVVLAEEAGDNSISGHKPLVIQRALKVVLRRFGLSPAQRMEAMNAEADKVAEGVGIL